MSLEAKPNKGLARLSWAAKAAKRQFQQYRQETRWRSKQYQVPAPIRVKWAVLQAYGMPEGTWIETGTFFGDTTEFLARKASHIYSIEPSPILAERARRRFVSKPNVTVLEGLSEDHFARTLEELSGTVSLWLDGHYSGGPTHKGPVETPIISELEAVKETLQRFSRLAVCVDDFRCFAGRNSGDPAYPTRSWLVEWAERCDLDWTVEHDIFVACKSP